MLLTEKHTQSLENLFHTIRLKNNGRVKGSDQEYKIKQICSYLEVIDAQVRKISKKKKLVFVDFAAGNCYLSFLVYHYYAVISGREIEIHCVDNNLRLMDNNRAKAQMLGFEGMRFYGCDILDFSLHGKIDITYSLHACDTATDKAIYMGLKLQTACILSVSCCQHSLKKNFKNHLLKGSHGYKSFKDRLLYMVADSMRAQLLEMRGYKIDIFNFTSSRNTDKNVMIRARNMNRTPDAGLLNNYLVLRNGFNVRPYLEELMDISLDTDFRKKSAS